MLSTLAHHHRIVSYLGASYRPHPVCRTEHLFIVTEFMQGVSNMSMSERENAVSQVYKCAHES